VLEMMAKSRYQYNEFQKISQKQKTDTLADLSHIAPL
jgi:hypothetical protein